MKSLILILFALFSLWTIGLAKREREKTNNIYNATTDEELLAQWNKYKLRNHKKYKGVDDLARFELFKKRINRVNKINNKYNNGSKHNKHHVKINKFSDMVNYNNVFYCTHNIIIFYLV